jgi:hypothetical protein
VQAPTRAEFGRRNCELPVHPVSGSSPASDRRTRNLDRGFLYSARGGCSRLGSKHQWTNRRPMLHQTAIIIEMWHGNYGNWLVSSVFQARARSYLTLLCATNAEQITSTHEPHPPMEIRLSSLNRAKERQSGPQSHRLPDQIRRGFVVIPRQHNFRLRLTSQVGQHPETRSSRAIGRRMSV